MSLSTTAILDATDRVLTRLETVESSMGTRLDPQQAAGARTTMQGIAADIKSITDGLAAIDESAVTAVFDGERALAVWRWRRSLRMDLITLLSHVQDLARVLNVYEKGAGESVVVAKEGDTLQSIAASELGSWEDWGALASRNPGLSPDTLAPGTAIIIPARR